MARGEDLCLWSALNFNFYIKASLKAVFLTVPNVLTVRLTLNANFSVRGEVGELHGQQGLQILGLQEFAIVGIILQRKPSVSAQSKVFHTSNFILIFFSLKPRVKRRINGSCTYKTQPQGAGGRLRLEGKNAVLTGVTQPALRSKGPQVLEDSGRYRVPQEGHPSGLPPPALRNGHSRKLFSQCK